MTGDVLVQALLRSKDGGGSIAANQLVKEIQEGYSAKNLKLLLNSENDWVASQAAWILAETAYHSLDLLPLVPSLVRHRSREVRYWTIDFVLLAASSAEGEYVVSALSLLCDDDLIVRSYAIRQFSRFDRRVLEAACDSARQSGSSILGMLERILRSDEEGSIALLRDANACRRASAACSLLRHSSLTERILSLMENSFDPAVSRTAAAVRATS